MIVKTHSSRTTNTGKDSRRDESDSSLTRPQTLFSQATPHSPLWRCARKHRARGNRTFIVLRGSTGAFGVAPEVKSSPAFKDDTYLRKEAHFSVNSPLFRPEKNLSTCRSRELGRSFQIQPRKERDPSRSVCWRIGSAGEVRGLVVFLFYD